MTEKVEADQVAADIQGHMLDDKIKELSVQRRSEAGRPKSVVGKSGEGPAETREGPAEGSAAAGQEDFSPASILVKALPNMTKLMRE